MRLYGPEDVEGIPLPGACPTALSVQPRSEGSDTCELTDRPSTHVLGGGYCGPGVIKVSAAPLPGIALSGGLEASGGERLYLCTESGRVCSFTGR